MALNERENKKKTNKTCWLRYQGRLVCFTDCVYEMAQVSDSSGVAGF